MRLIDADALRDEVMSIPPDRGLMYTLAIAKMIDDALTIDPENMRSQWIPVAERLPPEEQYVLITQKERYPGQAEEGEFHPVVEACFSDNCWFMPDGEMYFYDEDVVYAWMPLPEPYEPDGRR